MANEAVIVELLGDRGNVIDVDVANTVAVPKGSLIVMSGSPLAGRRVAKVASGLNDPFLGIASAEKVSGDGATQVGVYTSGIFDLTMTGNCSGGNVVFVSGANLVGATATGSMSGGHVGKLLEHAINAEVAEVLIGA